MKKNLTRCILKKYTVYQFKPSIGVPRQKLDNLRNYQHGQYDKKKRAKIEHSLTCFRHFTIVRGPTVNQTQYTYN